MKLPLTLLLIMSLFSKSFSQIPDKAENISPLLIGEKLPEATLQNALGEQYKVSKIINKPTVVVFYRGGWCPYCNLQLSGLATIEQEILALGYQIIAISPDDYQNLQPTIKKDKIGYQVFSDIDAAWIQKIGIAFQTPRMLKGFIATKGQIGKTSEVMPVPSVFIVNAKRTIKFQYINPNYKERISGKLLLAVLNALE